MTATTDALPASWQPSPGLLDALSAAQRIGAVGPGSLEEHVRHAAGFLAAAQTAADRSLDPHLRLLDLGSGGGIPGLVLAELLPHARCTLLDGRTERARLLDELVEALQWNERVRARAQRAEEAARDPALRGAFDLVTARGFAAPAVVAECAAPFLAPGALLVVSEPPAGGVSRWPSTGLAPLGLEVLGGALTLEVAPGQLGTYQVLRQRSVCPERWPRRTGIPAKRPLF